MTVAEGLNNWNTDAVAEQGIRTLGLSGNIKSQDV